MLLYTSQYHYIDKEGALDITMKCKPHSLGVHFQPNSWDLVKGFKSGKYTAAQYTELYLKKLEYVLKFNSRPFLDLLFQPRVVLVCFCNPTDFCHRFLLKDFIIKHYGDFVSYEGEILRNGTTVPHN